MWSRDCLEILLHDRKFLPIPEESPGLKHWNLKRLCEQGEVIWSRLLGWKNFVPPKSARLSAGWDNSWDVKEGYDASLVIESFEVVVFLSFLEDRKIRTVTYFCVKDQDTRWRNHCVLSKETRTVLRWKFRPMKMNKGGIRSDFLVQYNLGPSNVHFASEYCKVWSKIDSELGFLQIDYKT